METSAATPRLRPGTSVETGARLRYFAPKKRQAKVFASTGVTCLCILVDLFFIWGCIKLKQSSNSTTALGGTVLQAVGIPIFSFLYHARRADSPRTGFGDAAAAP